MVAIAIFQHIFSRSRDLCGFILPWYIIVIFIVVKNRFAYKQFVSFVESGLRSDYTCCLLLHGFKREKIMLRFELLCVSELIPVHDIAVVVRKFFKIFHSLL
jgi:hypothetical protein